MEVTKERPYLLKIWGGDMQRFIDLEKPDKLHDDCAYYWFHSQQIRDEAKTMANRFSSQIATDAVNPIDEDGNEVFTHERTVCMIDFKLPSGEIKNLVYDFGYGYPAHSAEYMWREGNYSCDCNKSSFLDLEEMPCGNTIEIVSFKIKYMD